MTMIRMLLVLCGLALAAALAAFAIAARVAVSESAVYTVAQVEAGLAHRPAAWVGRTILVRGIAYPMAGSTCPNTNPYCDGIALADEAAASPNASTLTITGRPADAWAFLRRVPVLGRLAMAPRDPAWGRPATYRVRFVARPYSLCGPACTGARLLGVDG